MDSDHCFVQGALTAAAAAAARAMNSKTLISLQWRPCMLSYIENYMNKRINAQLFIVRSHRPAILADNRPVDLWHSRLITSMLCELICIRQASMGLRVSLSVGTNNRRRNRDWLCAVGWNIFVIDVIMGTLSLTLATSISIA